MEMFPRGHQHGVLDGVEDHLRIDPLLFGEDLDRLINSSHAAHKCFPFCGGLPLELEVGLLHLIEWKLDALARRGLERDDPFGEVLQGAHPMALILDGLAKNYLDLLAHEAFELA